VLLLGEALRVETPCEEDLVGDPSAEVEVLLLLLARKDPGVGLRAVAAGSGTEKRLCSLGYHGVKLALVDRSLVCRSKPGC
jgi:hypothetical protein